ncbi:unnamed protein product [Caenorhabditis sp. 36 PRJEB53466]|nr:unnamed protein product [Caenorhabditis sp. 36 PRJEB53466]
MTDSPSPIDSSFDASDVATPCTVIAAKQGLRHQREEEEDSHGEDDVSAIYVDDFSKEFNEGASSVMEPLPRPATFARTITKVYCHMDDQELPYLVEVHVPPDCITLRDVIRKLPRTNFKYYCIALDPDTGLEVKAEIRDDTRRLHPLRNDRFELYLLTVEGSVHSDTSSGRHGRKKHGSQGSRESQRGGYYEHASAVSDSEASSLPTYVKKAHAFNRRQAHDRYPNYHQKPSSHRPQNHYEESTFDVTDSDIYGGGETYYDEDEDDGRSINTDLTSVSQQHLRKKYRQQQKEMRRKFRNMSTTSSSLSSITDSSMGLEVITVRLNLESMPLGMIPSGHTNARGDAGLYVGDIQDRGAVALDGRIDVGDMIVAINNISLSNYSNKRAVQLLRDAVLARRHLTLTVAKTGEKRAFPRNPRQEPVRPIDTNEWLKHVTPGMKGMLSIPEESSATPIPDEWPSMSSAASGTPFGGGPPSVHQLNVLTDKKYVVEVMAAPGSGLEIKDREWLKIPIPMSFLGRDLVDWLLDHVRGLAKREESCAFAGEMLKLGYIQHVVEKKHFSEKCYYVMGEECADYTQLRAPDGGFRYPPSQASSASASTQSQANATNSTHNVTDKIFPPHMYTTNPSNRHSAILTGAAFPQPSMVSGYASMPTSPFPTKNRTNGSVKTAEGDCGRTRDDQRSQTSGSSRGSRRYVELPRKPSSLGNGSNNESIPIDRVASRSSFRAAMSGSLRQFNIDS